MGKSKHNLFATQILVGAIFSSAGVFAAPATCTAPKLYDLSVYSIDNIEAHESDYQGSVALGGSFMGSNFLFDGDLSKEACPSVYVGKIMALSKGAVKGSAEVGGELQLSSAKITQNLYAPNRAYLNEARVYGKVYSQAKPSTTYASDPRWVKNADRTLLSLSTLPEELRSESYDMRTLSSTIKENATAGQMYLKLGANSLDVIHLSGEELEKTENIVIDGTQYQKLVINIGGRSIALKDRFVYLTGGILPGNIYWNFYEAESLLIQNTGEPVLGMPGRILAPTADVQFYDGLITGGLYVGNISFDLGRFGNAKSGQVNRLPTEPGQRPNN